MTYDEEHARNENLEDVEKERGDPGMGVDVGADAPHT